MHKNDEMNELLTISLTFSYSNISGPIGFGPYDTFSFNITLLDEFSDYVVRVVAFNAIGQNAWDGSGTTLATFSTLDSVPLTPNGLIVQVKTSIVRLYIDLQHA